MYITHLFHDNRVFSGTDNSVLLLALMTDLAIHFRLRQMPSQFSWTFSSKTTRLWIPQNTIPSYPSLLPIDHLSCLIVCEHHQIKLSPLPPFPHFDNLHSITVIFLFFPHENDFIGSYESMKTGNALTKIDW